jgi:hypothetical protein
MKHAAALATLAAILAWPLAVAAEEGHVIRHAAGSKFEPFPNVPTA